jgi:capsular exopolysaccharide synthesis family protein
VASYAQLITGPDLTSSVVEQLDLPFDAEDLADRIEAEAVAETVLIDVRVTDESPERALAIARTVAAELPPAVARLESGTGSRSPVRVSVADAPQLPQEPSSPRMARDVAIAAALGLFAGLVLALVRPAFDRRVRTPEQAAAFGGVPVVGMMRRDRRLRARPARSDVVSRGGPAVQEDVRRIRTNLQLLDPDRFPTVLVLASARAEDGRTTLAVHAGLAFAEVGRTVTLVEARPGAPSLARELGVDGEPGLLQVLSGEADLDEAIRPCGRGLSVVPVGGVPADGAALLDVAAMAPLLEKLRGRSDLVIVEAPPVLEVSAAVELARLADGVLLVVRQGRTSWDELEETAAALEFAGVRPRGVVLSRVPRSWSPGSWARGQAAGGRLGATNA